jgi:hypothetical protein
MFVTAHGVAMAQRCRLARLWAVLAQEQVAAVADSDGSLVLKDSDDFEARGARHARGGA